MRPLSSPDRRCGVERSRRSRHPTPALAAPDAMTSGAAIARCSLSRSRSRRRRPLRCRGPDAPKRASGRRSRRTWPTDRPLSRSAEHSFVAEGLARFSPRRDESDHALRRGRRLESETRCDDRIQAKGGVDDRTRPATPSYGNRIPHPGGWSAPGTSFLPRRSGDRGQHAILGVSADYQELTEPLLDRLSLYAHRRIEVEIRFGLSSGP